MLLDTFRFIYNHPYNADNKLRGILRFVKWQINCKLNPYPIVYPFTGHTKMLVWKGLAGATGNIYCGLLEYDDMCFLLHFLRPEDVFFDIGANVGAYTLLASGEIGAKTISVEPIPSTFGFLSSNISLNKLEDKVDLLNVGLGNQQGTLKFTKSFDTINHVATGKETGAETIEVQVMKMDDVSSEIPALVKIDVEGFETEVLNGASDILSNPGLKAIIIELNGSGGRYGFDEEKIHQSLLNFGFKTYKYIPAERKLHPIPKHGNHNTIYIRDEGFVENRLVNARKVKVGRKEI